LALDEPKDSDEISEYGDVKYLIDRDLLGKTGDITIDFVVEGWNSGFTLTSQNPVSDACSAGGSCPAGGSCG